MECPYLSSGSGFFYQDPFLPQLFFMTALQQLSRMPQSFLDIVREANDQVFMPAYHTLDNPMRYVDVFELYSGSSRLSSFCDKAILACHAA